MAGRVAVVPKGIDTLDDADMRALDAMRDTPVSATDDLAGPEPAISTPTPAASPSEAPTVEPEEDDDTATAPKTADPSRTVPHQAFHAEREKRKSAEARIAEVERKAAEDRARFEERVNMLVAASQMPPASLPATPAEEPLPDVTVDPVGHFQAVSQRQARELDSMKGILTGLQTQQQQALQVNALRNWGATQEQEFEAREPAYRDAMNHLARSRREELARMGIVDPQQQAQILGRDIQQIAEQTRSQGKNFAETLFDLAKIRGFAPTAVPAAPVPATPQVPPIAASVPAAIDIPAAQPDLATARAQRGRESATTLGSIGTAPAARLTPSQIADMSEAQFDTLMQRLRGGGGDIRDILGH